MKLKNLLIGGFLVIALLIGVVSILSISSSEKAMTETIGESSVDLTGQVLSEIDKDISNRIYEWDSLLQSKIVQDALKASNEEFSKIPDVESVIDARDKEWIATTDPKSNALLTSLLTNEVSQEFNKKLNFYAKEYGYPVYGEIFITNKYGVNVAQTGKTSDYRQNDEGWWNNAAKDGVFVEEVEYDDSAKAYVTALCIRIDDENGNMIGVAKVALDIAENINAIKEIKSENQYSSANFELVDNSGNIIYSTEESGVLVPSKMAAQLDSKNGWKITSVGGKDELIASSESKGYRNYKGLGWVLIASYDKDEILSPVMKLKTLLITISLVVVLLAVCIGILLSHLISKPVIDLKNALDKVTEGNFDVKLPQSKITEVVGLTGSAEIFIQGFKAKMKKK